MPSKMEGSLYDRCPDELTIMVQDFFINSFIHSLVIHISIYPPGEGPSDNNAGKSFVKTNVSS